jgi:hypothetical protein
MTTEKGLPKIDSIEIIPWRNDFVFISVASLGKKNPFLIGLLYFVVEFLFMYVIGLLTGQFHGKMDLHPCTRVFLITF